MHFTLVLLVASSALRTLAAPLPVATTESDELVGHHHTPLASITLHALTAPLRLAETSNFDFHTRSNHQPLPSWSHLSQLPHASDLVFDERLASPHQDESRHGPLLIDHSTEMVPRSNLTNKPQPASPSSIASQPKNPKPKPAGSTTSQVKHAEIEPPEIKPVPSVEEIKEHLRVVPDKSLFYCGGRRGFFRAAQRRARETGEQILNMAWTDRSMLRAVKHFDVEEGRLFWDNASRAFAELSSGTVHVLLEDKVGLKNFKKDSVWARVEWPVLQANPLVTKVVKVTQSGAEETLFDRTHPSAS